MSSEPSVPSPEPPPAVEELMAPPTPLPGSTGGTEPGGVQVAPATTVSSPAGVSPGTRAEAADDAAKQEFLWHTHEYLNEYARFADSKAGFAGTLAGALLASLYGAQAHVPLLTTVPGAWTLASWLTLLSVLALASCVGLAIWVVAPRLATAQATGFIYWQSVAGHGTCERLQASFKSQSVRELNDHLLAHIFDISSKVCVPKYRVVRACVLCLCVGAALAAGAMILKDLPASPPPPAAVGDRPSGTPGDC